MSKTVQVKLGDRSYPIIIGSGLSLATLLKGEKGVTALVVSDSNVDRLHGECCLRRLEAQGIESIPVVIPAGESSKSLTSAAMLYDKAAGSRLDRNSVVVALGGGMVGDLAGFVAATYLRGVRFVQIPTTLLAMVDSSVGGKTGVNLERGKNLVGSFHQPIEVNADLDLLATLPAREYVSGLAEVVKYGVIWDAAFFAFIERRVDDLLRRDQGLLEQVVARCCEIKAEVVAMDEREIGPRAILNFGHTLGHAVEKSDGYGHWLHGEAVAIGMHFAARLSVKAKGLADGEAARIVDVLRRMGLPIKPEHGMGMGWAKLWDAMLSDKKTVQKRPRFVLAERLGSVMTGCEVPEELLMETWNVCCQ
jgi:3-dehydroquinate synthase